MLDRIHPHPWSLGWQASADPPVPGFTRGRADLVPAPSHRRMLGHPDRGQLPPAPSGLALAQQRTFGQVDPCDVVPVPAYLAARAPREVIATRSGHRLVAARTQRRRPPGRHGDHRDTDACGGVRERSHRFAAGGLRRPIVVDSAMSAVVVAGVGPSSVVRDGHRAIGVQCDHTVPRGAHSASSAA